MKETLLYLSVGISFLIVLSYTIHMFVGGLVTTKTEYLLIAASCLIAVGVMGFMARDIIQRRNGLK
jgi:hypothetical protein